MEPPQTCKSKFLGAASRTWNFFKFLKWFPVCSQYWEPLNWVHGFKTICNQRFISLNKTHTRGSGVEQIHRQLLCVKPESSWQRPAHWASAIPRVLPTLESMPGIPSQPPKAFPGLGTLVFCWAQLLENRQCPRVCKELNFWSHVRTVNIWSIIWIINFLTNLSARWNLVSALYRVWLWNHRPNPASVRKCSQLLAAGALSSRGLSGPISLIGQGERVNSALL